MKETGSWHESNIVIISTPEGREYNITSCEELNQYYIFNLIYIIKINIIHH